MSTPTITPSDPQAMPLADLKTAAGLDGAQPIAAPEPIAAPVAVPATPDPFTLTQEGDTFVLKYATGEVFKGASETEAYRKAAENAVTNIQYAKQLKAERDAQAQRQVQPQAQPQVPTQPKIDPAELLTAQWQRDQTDMAEAYELGVSVEQLRYNRRLAFEAAPNVYLDNQANNFKQMCKDWVETPDNLKAMNDYFEGWNTLPNANTLRLAWLDLKDAGKVTPLTPQQAAPAAARPPIMPSPGGSGPTGDQNAWTMPLDQLKTQAGLG